MTTFTFNELMTLQDALYAYRHINGAEKWRLWEKVCKMAEELAADDDEYLPEDADYMDTLDEWFTTNELKEIHRQVWRIDGTPNAKSIRRKLAKAWRGETYQWGSEDLIAIMRSMSNYETPQELWESIMCKAKLAIPVAELDEALADVGVEV